MKALIKFMTHRLELRKIKTLGLFSFPIVLGMMSQNLINIVDTIMLGHIGKKELAAVGISSIALSAFQAISFGVSDGVQFFASKFNGLKEFRKTADVIMSGLFFSLITGGVITLFSFFASTWLFQTMGLEGTILVYAADYFMIRGLASIFASGNFAFRGFWNGVENSKTYLKVLFVMHGANLLGNFLLIYGEFGFPRLGIHGAAISSAISIGLGFFIFLILTIKNYPLGRLKIFLFKKISFISFQSGFELLITLAAMTLMFSMIESFGEDVLAGANILHNYFIFILFPVLGIGVAAAALAGNRLSQGNEEVLSWLHHGLFQTFVLISLLSLIIGMLGEYFLALFTSFEAVIEASRVPFWMMCFSLPFEMVGYFIAQAFLSLGKPFEVLKVTGAMLWFVFIPSVYIGFKFFNFNLNQIWICLIGYRIIQSGWFLLKLRKARFSLS